MIGEAEKYKIGPSLRPCGVTFLKILLGKAEVDNRTKATKICKNLTCLDTYMSEVAKGDIVIFNTYVHATPSPVEVKPTPLTWYTCSMAIKPVPTSLSQNGLSVYVKIGKTVDLSPSNSC